MKDSKKNWVSWIMGILGTFFASWFGTYLYDILNLETRFDSSLSFIRFFFSDYPYKNAVSTLDLSLLERYGYIIAGSIFGVSIMFLTKIIKGKNKDKFMLFSTLFFLIMSVILYLYSAPISMIFKNVARERNNIEIIKPYITDDEYDRFISSYYQIQNKNDFKNIQIEIKDIANEHSLNLQ